MTTRDQVDQSQASGSTVSGNTVSVAAGKDVNVTGSNVVSTRGTQIAAAGDVNIVAASDKSDSTHVRNEVTSGLFSGGGFGVTIGKQEMDNKNRTVSSTAVSSTVGSTEGNVAISAGSGYKQVGSNVMAPKGDIDIIAKKISILAETDSERNTQDVVFKQSGLTLQITSPVLSAIQTVQQMKKAAESTTDGRMKLLAAANIGFAGKNAYDAVKTGQGVAVDGKDNPQVLTNARNEDGSLKMGADGKPETRDATAADKVGGINLAISLGASKNESHSEASANTVKGSTVAAGGNVSMVATGGGADSNITIQGSNIKAGVNATLKAENEVRLLAAQNTTEQHSSNKGMSASVGVSVGTDGLLFSAGVSGSRGRGDGNDVAQVNTHVDAGNKLTIESGTDTTIKGAVVSGKQVVMDVGSASGSESSTTRSGISQAEIKITDDAAQQVKTGKTAAQTIASINTDVSSDRDTSGKLNKTWNGQALQADVQAQAQIMEMFGKNAAKEIGTYATRKVDELDRQIEKATGEERSALIAEREKWQEGGIYRTALHSAAGSLAGGIGGAVGAATSSMSMPYISDLIDGMSLTPAVKDALSQVAAAALGGVTGGASGLVAGVTVEANNRQLHQTERDWAKENARKYRLYLEKERGETVTDEEAYQRLLSAGYAIVDSAAEKSGRSDESAKQFIAINKTKGLFEAGYNARNNPFLIPLRSSRINAMANFCFYARHADLAGILMPHKILAASGNTNLLPRGSFANTD